MYQSTINSIGLHTALASAYSVYLTMGFCACSWHLSMMADCCSAWWCVSNQHCERRAMHATPLCDDTHYACHMFHTPNTYSPTTLLLFVCVMIWCIGNRRDERHAMYATPWCGLKACHTLAHITGHHTLCHGMYGSSQRYQLPRLLRPGLCAVYPPRTCVR